jgi:hypothetical protein
MLPRFTSLADGHLVPLRTLPRHVTNERSYRKRFGGPPYALHIVVRHFTSKSPCKSVPRIGSAFLAACPCTHGGCTRKRELQHVISRTRGLTTTTCCCRGASCRVPLSTILRLRQRCKEVAASGIPAALCFPLLAAAVGDLYRIGALVAAGVAR